MIKTQKNKNIKGKRVGVLLRLIGCKVGKNKFILLIIKTMNTLIKKSTIAILTLAVVGITAMPLMASADSFVRIRNGVNSVVIRSNVGENGNMVSINGVTLNNTAAQDARKTYNTAVKNANKTYTDARKSARDKMRTALSSAGNDFSKRMTAYTTYLSEILAAFNQRSTAKATALQAYINALKAIQSSTNQAPTANNQSVSTNEETPKAITLTGSDPESSALTYSVVANPSHGALSGTIPNLTYTPATNYSGSDSFTFKVNDGTQDSNTATISITVIAVNDAPVATAQSASLAKNVSSAITLTGSDPENSTLSYFVVTNPVHGTLSGTVPNLTYLPATDYTGSDSFTFKVNDGSLDSAVATVSITVNP